MPGRPDSSIATDHRLYASKRSQWPCSQAACNVLLGPSVTQLAAALLDCDTDEMHNGPRLFNDQVQCERSNPDGSGIVDCTL